MQLFNFTLPIGWDELSAVFTTLAVIVALWANHNSNKQLKSTLQMHEQSKSVELLDKRIDLLRKIEADDISVDLEIQVLFNDKITQNFRALKKLHSDLQEYGKELETYSELLQEAYDKPDEEDPIFRLNHAEAKMAFFEYSQDAVDKFEELCRKYEIRSTLGAPEGEYKTYNYKEISNSIATTKDSISTCKAKLTEDMMTFIKKSLEPLVKEEKQK